MAPLEVICPGLGRTGTYSLSEALDTLGYKTHHMKYLALDPTYKTSIGFYQAYLDKENADWDSLYEGYNAATDFSAASFYKGLLKKYPDAKVILTERPFEGWYKSMYNTIHQGLKTTKEYDHDDPELIYHKACVGIVMDGKVADPKEFEDVENIKKEFDEHYREIRRLVPPENLYIMRMGEGWEGICNFLGKEVPNQPYPHSNSTEDFFRMFQNKNLTS
ncbi:hypothetical protein A0J61_08391 [Choanephora cucurbitarum]|uniref:Uncharacterized protein n=1 Tax=Choanephora cucurbitarum TaxID=101091 RepID=A0A1C7N379_9FUNG|nr:hypothetical protein A0J61_08391 [Choanephora cucurbitarum]